jgi:hypothetical protein
MAEESNREPLVSIYEQHRLHARHAENERLWFTNIYMILVGVLLSSTLGAEQANAFWPWPILFVIFSFSILGFCMCHALRIAFVHASIMADNIAEKEWGNQHISYQNNVLKKFQRVNFHMMFSLIYIIMSSLSFGFLIYEFTVKQCECSQVIAILAGIILFVFLYYCIQKQCFNRNEQGLRKEMKKSKMGEPEVLYNTRAQTLEVFSGEDSIRRGIKRRFKYDIKGVLIYDAELIPTLQEGHKHSVSYEAIMLVKGEIKACYYWNNKGKTETTTLHQRGDMVAFHPGQNHTLFVKKESHVIVTRFKPIDTISQKDEREMVLLPGNLQSFRDKLLENPDQKSNIFKEIDRELVRLGEIK